MSSDILVVEDEAGIRELIRSMFTRQYDVTTVADGASAWDRLLERADDPPDVVVLDVMLPGLDGFTLLQRMRDHPTLAAVPIVVVSGRSREEDVRRALEGGATDFVTKPFEPETLHSSVRRAIERERRPA